MGQTAADMSSLAAARADNFYHPPEWDPQKISRDAYQGSNGANQYEQKGVIRFEMPFNVRCLGCQKMIGQGVRFNAKKDQDGFYHTTKIWKFTMTCHLCHHELIITTDPKNTEYALTQGLVRYCMDYNAEDAGTVELMSADERAKIAADPFTNLEYKKKKEQKAAEDKPIIAALHQMADDRWDRDYEANRALRRNFRGQKKDIKAQEVQRELDVARAGVPLLPISMEDRLAATRVDFSGLRAGAHQQKKRAALMSGSIFGSNPKSLSGAHVRNVISRGPQKQRGVGQRATPSAISKRLIIRKKS